METHPFAYILLALFSGSLAGACFHWLYHRSKVGSYQKIAQDIVERAEFETDALKNATQLSIKQNQVDQQRELERLWQLERKKIQHEEDRIKVREDKLEARLNLVEKKLSDIEKREAILIARKAQLDEERRHLQETVKRYIGELERVSGLSHTEAKETLLARLTNEVKTDAANLTRKIMKEAEENAEKEAAKIIVTAIGRLAGSSVSDATVAVVSIPSEDMKGRIIGREGRNIRALERATGVNFIIDETPGAVVLSSFDPIRREIAKVALTELILDGRIHPTRIEEVVEKAVEKVQKAIKQQGEDAALRIGALNMHPEMINLLGKLAYRYSYGQNVLKHSLEVAHLMGLMATELGLDPQLAKRIGLLHDVGKAVTHEIEGTHALIGHDLALKYGEAKTVANGIGCHHQEMEPITVEGSLCAAADALSASRPGARIEAVEEYMRRLKKLEEIAYEFPGVEKAYAMQAGREVWVVVLPDMIDDDGLINLARDLKTRVENVLDYPGKIKVTVIREKRAVEYAV